MSCGTRPDELSTIAEMVQTAEVDPTAANEEMFVLVSATEEVIRLVVP